MLFLLCKIGKDAYALDASQVAHVLPLVHVSPAGEDAPRGLAGFFSYRGTLVPVVNLGTSGSRQLRAQFSTRVVLVQYPNGRDTRLIGLIADQATDIIRREPSEFVPSGVAAGSGARGSLIDSRHGIVQWIDVSALLPRLLREGLFTEAVPA